MSGSTDASSFTHATPAGYCFGLTGESVAAGLRRLAADVEAGLMLPQSVELKQDARHEDFVMAWWVLTFRAAPKHTPIPESHQVGA